ncbi:hypothetical protein HYT04_02620 [Candidatus Kaiserbacteria bacterium]|nr:hypothetical protein [Candidatus Kaiserbacteria bacterium]
MLVRCHNYIKDTHPGKGFIASHLVILNLTITTDWQILIKYDFNTTVRDEQRDGKFALSTETHIVANLFGGEAPEDAVTQEIFKGLVDTSELQWGARPLRCSISFASGTNLEDVPRSHCMVLPIIISAYVDLKSGFVRYTRQLEDVVNFDQAQLALDELLKRLSAFAAQATEEQMKNNIGL